MAEQLSRRSALRGAAVVVVAGGAGYVVASDSDAAAAAAPGTAANGYAAKPSAGGKPVARLSDIPPGGGVVVADADLVVVREAGGAVKAFSATCTHQGCRVGSVEHGVISCPCHGSRFSARDGSVRAGPATAPLPEVAVTVRGGEVFEK